ncbi:MAG: hypothetical protein RSB76_03350 [Clostridia bacterium]
MIYATEPLAYYFCMKPNEFWYSTYREINIYCQSNISKILDEFKREIQLQEVITDKIILADSMSKKPKVIRLHDTFENLFPKKENINNIEEITRRMRLAMRTEKLK